MFARIGARGAARNQRKNALKNKTLGFGRLNPHESLEDEADKDLHSTIVAYEVHVERFLAQLPTLHRRDQAKEFFQLTRVRHPEPFPNPPPS